MSKESEPKRKRGGDNGKRKPIVDDMGQKWCNCTTPKLVSSEPYPMREHPSCTKCGYPWYH